MPNITGTGSNDDIDVTNDNGTLNGSGAGTPIDDISARGGNDTISVADSTISGDVRGNSGDDVISVEGSTIGGQLSSGRNDDAVSVSGSTIDQIRLGNGNDTLDFISTNISGDIRGGSGTDALNLPVGTVVNDSSFGTFTVSLGSGYSLSSGTFTLPSGVVVTYTTFENGTGIPCFCKDTLIETAHGTQKIQNLRVGDIIPTASNGLQKIRWIGRRDYGPADLKNKPKLRPVRIVAGALGNGLPRRDLLVSRQHRMLLSSKIARRMFGTEDVLVSAIKLTELPGIFVDEDVQNVAYFHILFDRHEVITAEGAPSESLYTGPEALRAISPAARSEIFEIFPELRAHDYVPKPVVALRSDKQQKQLVARHAKNHKPVLQLFDARH